MKEFLSNKLIQQMLFIVFSTVFIFILYRIILRVTDRSFEKIKTKNNENSKRLDTIHHILKSVLFYVFIFIEVIAILTIIWGPVPLTFAGIATAAFAVAGQSFMKDIINGFFIILENQYAVGDYVTIGQYSGILEGVNLRTTLVKDFNGVIHIIPNGSILSITNHSKCPQRFEVNVNIGYSNSIDFVLKTVNDILDKINKEYTSVITDEAYIQGIDKFTPLGLNIRILGFSKPCTQIEIQNKIRYEIKKAFEEKNISFSKYDKW